MNQVVKRLWRLRRWRVSKNILQWGRFFLLLSNETNGESSRCGGCRDWARSGPGSRNCSRSSSSAGPSRWTATSCSATRPPAPAPTPTPTPTPRRPRRRTPPPSTPSPTPTPGPPGPPPLAPPPPTRPRPPRNSSRGSRPGGCTATQKAKQTNLFSVLI